MSPARGCPICHRPLGEGEAPAPYRPFCSQRCKTVDLGGWLTGAYRISRPLSEEELDEGVPGSSATDGGEAPGPSHRPH
jgi:hypothetical protein